MNKSTTTDGTEQPPTETALERLPQKGMRIEEAAFPFSSSSVDSLSPRNNNVITLIHAFIYLTPCLLCRVPSMGLQTTSQSFNSLTQATISPHLTSTLLVCYHLLLICARVPGSLERDTKRHGMRYPSAWQSFIQFILLRGDALHSLAISSELRQFHTVIRHGLSYSPTSFKHVNICCSS